MFSNNQFTYFFFYLTGWTIIVGMVFLVTIAIIRSWRNLRFEEKLQTLQLNRLTDEIKAAKARFTREQNQTGISWNGTRKFKILQKVVEAKGICSFYLIPHDKRPLPPFLPGQYVTLSLRINDQRALVTRCYSLSDTPFNLDHYRITIKQVPATFAKSSGGVSSFFHDHLKAGDIVDVKAPTGNFVLNLEQHSGLVLIAGGIGITPLLSMLLSLIHLQSKREVWFFYSVANSNEHIMKPMLAEIQRTHENIHMQICYTQPLTTDIAGRDYHYHQRITIDLLQQLLPSNNYEFLICGPCALVESTIAGLKAWDVPEEKYSFEAFGQDTARNSLKTNTTDAHFKVQFTRSHKTLTWSYESGSLLDMAHADNIPLDSGCRAGHCGACLIAVKAGDVDYLSVPSETPEVGSCLACLAIPKTDLVIDA